VTRAARLRRKAVGTTEIRGDRIFWVPPAYSRDFLGLTDAIDCGDAADLETQETINKAFRAALQKRKQWRQRRRLERETLPAEELRTRRNREVAERIVAAHARQDREAA
jgi:hypothetical protein